MNGIEQALIGGVDGGTAILLPGLGELVSQRSGVVNLGTEGCMLAGALASYAAAVDFHSAWVGVVIGMLAGSLCGGLHAWLVVKRKADQLASGLVIWFLALGVTSVFGSSFINKSVPPIAIWKIPLLGSIPWVGRILFDHDGLVYLSFVLVAAVWFLLYRTRMGLTLRATGERPEVVAATGGHPDRVKFLAVMLGAGLAGIGGAQLSVGYVDNWFNDMTNGYGFVAVAVVLFAAWRPVTVFLGSMMFGVALAAASVIQAHGIAVNQYLLDSLPYVITLIALVAFSRRGSSQAPEGLSKALTSSG